MALKPGYQDKTQFKPEVKAIVWGLMCAGHTKQVILSRLLDGTAGLDYSIEISMGTVEQWMRQFRKQRGDPLTWGGEETSEDSTRSIRAQLLQSLRIQANLFHADALKGTIMSSTDIKAAGEIAKCIDDLERRTAVRKGEAVKSQQSSVAEERHDSVKILDKLVDAEVRSARNSDHS